MTKMMIEIDSEDYNKLRDLCNMINDDNKGVLFPYYVVDTTELMAVPQFEGDEREYMIAGKRVLGKDVNKYIQENNITFDEFKEQAIHTCDYKGVAKLEGFFLTEDDCYNYIDANIANLRHPFPLCKSMNNLTGMKDLILTLFKITGVEPSKSWQEPNPVEIIESYIREDAANSGYKLEENNVKKIAKAKNMMFGLKEWRRCPCEGTNSDRYCGSELCKADIERDGVCHCHLHLKADNK
jgi:hypothetical protein